MDTIPKLLDHQAETRGHREALRAKRLGLWKSMTWAETLTEVQRFACGLVDLGVVKGDTIAVIGGNTPRIFCAITACQAVGALPVPIYSNLAGDVLGNMLEKVTPRYVVAEDQQQVDDVLALDLHGCELKAMIYTVGRGMRNYDRNLMHDFEAVQKRGDKYLSSHPGVYSEMVNAGSPDDPAMILFTSGINELPKPAVLSYKNMLNVANYIAELEGLSEKDEVLSFMPIFLPVNMMSGYVLSHVTGMCVSCPESTETVMENMSEIAPSLLYAPPHVYKQIRAAIRERITLTRGLSRKLYDRYMAKAMQGKHSKLGEILVFAPVRELYGLNHLRVAFTSGDAIGKGDFDFFSALGVKLQHVYGAVETSGFITMQIDQKTEETVGKAVRGMEIKVTDNGEIMCRGENVFSSYYKDEQLTNAAFDKEGWFHTGDIGTLSSSGELIVMDKLTAVGKLRDGTSFMPKTIEKTIKDSLYINEVFVSGEGEESLVAVVTIDNSTVSAWAEHNNIRYAGYTELTANPQVKDLIRDEIAAANQRVTNNRFRVKSFLILHRQILPQTGELTWTHKIRRNKLKQEFVELTKAMHAGHESFDFNDVHSREQVKLKVVSF